MAPSNKAWIRGRMAGIRKASGIAFSDDIFLSILICLVAKNKHLVMHTHPDLVSDLKTVTEQHCAVVYGLTTATIICHGQQTRQDIIGAITGRHSDIVSHTASSSTAHYQYASTNTVGGSTSGTALGGHGAQGSLGHSQMYHYSNPGDDFLQQRHAMMRYEKSRRSIATTHSEMSEYSLRPSEKYAQSIRTMNGRDQKSYEDMASLHFAHRHSTISASIDPDEQDSMFKRDWDDLAKKMRRVTISNDMMRYIRDVVVGIRTHVEVDGGLTPRASQDLITVVNLEADDEDTGEEDDKSFIEKSDDAESLSSFVEKSPNDEELERNEGGRTTRSFQQHHQRLTNREHITPQSRHQVAQHHHQYPPYTSHETHGQHEQYNGSMEYYTVHKSAAEIIREVLNTIHPPI
ncbi:hypothetical protein BGW41_003247 [Actinomortierella wolfii]|nr:hypothetical protein BGW41_003247 [Actinomortierella wolfii]